LALQLPYNCRVLTLALDTSSPAGSIAILRDDELLALVSTRTEEAFSSRIFRQLDFLLNEVSVALDQFDLFAVVSGPGSFTGVRVGLTATKAWAEVFGKPVVAVSALEALAVQSGVESGAVFPVLDARRGQVYFGEYQSVSAGGFALVGEEFSATPEDFFSAIGSRPHEFGKIRVVTPNSRLISAAIARDTAIPELASKISIHHVSNILAPQAGRLAYRKAQAGQFDDSLLLDANYIRRPDAEVNWKGFHDS
jgi:tRNA threonylcarbamoyladenosine biosynthesis protein TsaB